MEDITCMRLDTSWTWQVKIRIHKRACNILFIILMPMWDGLFLLAETEVAMTTVMKDKNCIFTGHQIFITGKILVFRQCLYNK